MSSIPQAPVSIAYQFGVEAAQAGKPCEPEKMFLQKQQQDEYTQGYQSVTRPLQRVTVPNYKRNGCEYVTRTEQSAEAMIHHANAYTKRINEMIALTAEYLGEDTGEILFLA